MVNGGTTNSCWGETNILPHRNESPSGLSFNKLNLNTTLPIPWGIEYLNIVNSEFVRISLSKCLENKSKHNFTYSLRYNVIRGLAVLESVLEIIVLPLG